MKTQKIFAILIALLMVAVFAGCQKTENKKPKKQIPTSQQPYVFEGTENLTVGSCEEIFSELKAKNPNIQETELYKAASLILFNAKKTEEGKLCCDNITEEALRISCKIRNS